MIDNREAGRRIALLRQRVGLTQSQLAAMMNVSHQAVSKWEGGQALPDIQTLMKLTRFFGMTVEQLIGEDCPEAAEPEEARGAEVEHPDEEVQPREAAAAEVNQMNIQQLLQMAPYMTKEAVAEIALGMEGELSANQIARLAPYMTPESVEALVEKHHPEFTWDSLRRLAPHMRRETVDELARAIASGRQTVKPTEDAFNKTMNDIGRAFDDLGKGVDKAVRRALRFGESVFSEVSTAFGEMANDAQDAKVRSDRAVALRRRAFERALEDGRWDWLGEHAGELADEDELKRAIAARARELGMDDWIAEHMPGCADECAVESAIREGRWDWLGENLWRMGPEAQRKIARAALEGENWPWLEAHAETVDFGAEAEAFVRALWQKGQKRLAAAVAHGRLAAEQCDALLRDAEQADDLEMADLLWDLASPACARERLMVMAAANEWARVKERIASADSECMEKLMELAVEQGNFEAVDFLDDYL